MNEATILRAIQWIGLETKRTRRLAFIAFHLAVLAGVLTAAAIIPDRSGPTHPVVVTSEADQFVVYRYRIDRVDPRGVRGVGEIQPAPNDLVVSWVAGSSIVLGATDLAPSDRTLLPTLVADSLSAATQDRVRVNVYQVGGSGFADQVVAARAALSEKPDLLVVTANPAWVSNDLVLGRYPNFSQALAGHSVEDARLRFPFAVALAEPGDTALSAAGRAHRNLADYPDASKRVRSWVTSLDFIGVEPVARGRVVAAPGLPDLLSRSRNDASAFWWLVGAVWRGREADAGYRIGEGGDIANALLAELIDAAGDANIPLYMYMAPTDLDLGPDEARAVIDAKEGLLTRLGAASTDGAFVVDADILNERFPGITFRDRWHVDDPSDMPMYLASRLCGQLALRGLGDLDCALLDEPAS